MTHSNDQRHFGDQGNLRGRDLATKCSSGRAQLRRQADLRHCAGDDVHQIVSDGDVRTAYDLANAAYHDYARCIIGEAENRAITELKWPSTLPETRVAFAAGTSGLSVIECWRDCRFTRDSIAEAVRLETAVSGLWCTRACYACTAGATGSADPRPPAKTTPGQQNSAGPDLPEAT